SWALNRAERFTTRSYRGWRKARSTTTTRVLFILSLTTRPTWVLSTPRLLALAAPEAERPLAQECLDPGQLASGLADARRGLCHGHRALEPEVEALLPELPGLLPELGLAQIAQVRLPLHRPASLACPGLRPARA